MVEKFANNMEQNILNFSLNKCVADIYTLFNFLEKSKTYLFDNELSKKILVCIYPVLPRLTSTTYKDLFSSEISELLWPEIDKSLLKDDNLKLPIQIKGKLVTTIDTTKGYNENEIMKKIYQLEKIKSRVLDKKIIKVINVQDKIINIITN